MDTAAKELHYSIWDPAGNITALVESEVRIEDQPSAAAKIMERHPEVEQVGFVRFSPESPEFQVQLRMAGGEFCGNASMSAAALYVQQVDLNIQPIVVHLRVSGANQPVMVRLLKKGNKQFLALLQMPPSLDIINREFSFGKLQESLPVVQLEGISHVIIEPDSGFWFLKSDKHTAEHAVKDWCQYLSADGLGLMFLEETKESCNLTPLVYVPGSGTVFWENACASGSSAVGMFLASKYGKLVSRILREPGGTQVIDSDPVSNITTLTGNVRFVSQL